MKLEKGRQIKYRLDIEMGMVKEPISFIYLNAMRCPDLYTNEYSILTVYMPESHNMFDNLFYQYAYHLPKKKAK